MRLMMLCFFVVMTRCYGMDAEKKRQSSNHIMHAEQSDRWKELMNDPNHILAASEIAQEATRLLMLHPDNASLKIACINSVFASLFYREAPKERWPFLNDSCEAKIEKMARYFGVLKDDRVDWNALTEILNLRMQSKDDNPKLDKARKRYIEAVGPKIVDYHTALCRKEL